jgi:hypothetical protein
VTDAPVACRRCGEGDTEGGSLEPSVDVDDGVDGAEAVEEVDGAGLAPDWASWTMVRLGVFCWAPTLSPSTPAKASHRGPLLMEMGSGQT